MAKKQTSDKVTNAEKPAKVAQATQNGIVRPKVGTMTGAVWAIADKISAKKKEPAARADVLAQCAKDEINPSTANTQYGRWRKFNGLQAAPKKAAAKKDAASSDATVE